MSIKSIDDQISLETIFEIVSDNELNDIEFCQKLLVRALSERNWSAISIFIHKISNLFIRNELFRKEILDVMENVLGNLSLNSLNDLLRGSIVGDVFVLYNFLVKNPVIDLKALSTLSKLETLDKITEEFSEYFIPTELQVTLNIEEKLNYHATTEDLDKLIQSAEFLLNNRLLKRTPSSISGMKVLYKNSNSSLLRMRSEILTVQQPEDFSFPEYKQKIDEYANLLNKLAEEPDFQSFFERNPFFLNLHVLKCLSKQSLAGELIPDFVLELYDRCTLIIEIEKPSIKLYNKKGDPTQELVHAEQQLRDYLSWAIKDNVFLREHGIENISPNRTTGLLIIGSEVTDLEIKKLNERNKTSRATFIIKTFEDVLRENEVILDNLMKIENKS